MADGMNEELDATVPARLRGPLTRSSLKPRLLFPTPEQMAVRQKKKAPVTDEEEVMTDLEDPSALVSTPAKHLNDFAVTPRHSKVAQVAPVSPPTTARTTRNSKMDLESYGASSDPASPSTRTTRSNKMDIDSPARPANPATPPNRLRSGRVSPSASWHRTKTISPKQTRKREGDVITRSGGELTKRRRGGGRRPSN
jgi:hypothetical protein